jgi:hypothetical protein
VFKLACIMKKESCVHVHVGVPGMKFKVYSNLVFDILYINC